MVLHKTLHPMPMCIFFRYRAGAELHLVLGLLAHVRQISSTVVQCI